MPLLGYKKQFAHLVESGEKRQTILAMRKRPFKVGDRLYHYFGLRTKQCRKLMESDCISVDEIIIDEFGLVFINSKYLPNYGEDSYAVLAYNDGFRPDGWEVNFELLWISMLTFFRSVHGLPFKGQLIKW